MLARVLVMGGSLLGAGTLSQFPEYATQYQQRLGGAVEALTQVVEDFDRSAEKEGMTRDEALADMSGTAFLENRRGDMERTFGRHARLTEDLARIEAASQMEQLAMPQRFLDREIAEAALENFKPAVPLTAAGAVAAVAGYVLGWAVIAGLIRVLLWPFRRRGVEA